MRAVAVEQGLGPVKQYLEQQGCEVIDMTNGDQREPSVCAVVITGADKNVMGMQTIVNNVPVISADGLSPDDVYQRVRQFLH